MINLIDPPLSPGTVALDGSMPGGYTLVPRQDPYKINLPAFPGTIPLNPQIFNLQCLPSTWTRRSLAREEVMEPCPLFNPLRSFNLPPQSSEAFPQLHIGQMIPQPKPEPQQSPCTNTWITLPPLATRTASSPTVEVPIPKIISSGGIDSQGKKDNDAVAQYTKGQNVPEMCLVPPKLKPEESKAAVAEPSGDNAIIANGNLLKRTPQADNSVCKRLMAGQAYESRNVYKSIVRRIYTMIKNERSRLKEALKKLNFTEPEMEVAFEEISRFRTASKPKNIEKNSQVRIEKMLKTKSIFTYILRESLVSMIDAWEDGRYGQLSKLNSGIYLEVCKRFLREVDDLLLDRNHSSL